MEKINNKEIKNVYTKLQEARVLIQNRNLKKSGYNGFAKFHYYELGDFIPVVNHVFNDLGLTSYFNINDQYAELLVVNTENPNEQVKFTSILPNTPETKGSNPIQTLGAVHTYLKRYLYMNALELVENDIVDQSSSISGGSKAGKTSIDDGSDIFYMINHSQSLDDLNKVLSDFKTDMTKEAKTLLHHIATERYHGDFKQDVGKYVIAM